MWTNAKMPLLIAVTLFIPIIPLQAGHLQSEKEYQTAWCAEASGITEYVLDDRTRVDCMTEEYAIEFDFGPKWAEAIGQSLYYAMKTGKKPGVVLILEFEGEQYVKRLQVVANKYHIKVWILRPVQPVEDFETYK